MIELRNVSKKFNMGTANEVVALHHVNLTIDQSEFIVVVGANGSGKTSLLNAIAGTIEIDRGEILFDSNDISNLKDYQRSKWVARIFQNPVHGTASELSILENFRLASLRTQSKKLAIGTGERFINQIKEKISTLNLGLENKIHQPMGTLSGGQRQALALLMAVMDDTKILLMDEPTASLDPKTSELVISIADKIIKEFKLTALFVTHQLKDALRFGSRIILMQEGKIVKDVSSNQKAQLQSANLYQWYEAVS
jgi:putative tryptophan/tyrosine transport system ATP-binding protein